MGVTKSESAEWLTWYCGREMTVAFIAGVSTVDVSITDVRQWHTFTTLTVHLSHSVTHCSTTHTHTHTPMYTVAYLLTYYHFT